MSGKGFRDLIVWQKAKDLAVFIYKNTDSGNINKDYGLRDQIRRAAISIPSNIAEGDERETDKEAVRFFYIVPVREFLSVIAVVCYAELIEEKILVFCE
ncbi:MAG: four helix bundle protein [Planctomycetes bacterium]|nr:four helix bundle protein [Planctomycetota bacterium]